MLPENEATMLAGRLVEEKGTARDAEQWTKDALEYEAGKSKKDPVAGAKPRDKAALRPLPVELREIQRILRDHVNTKVEITQSVRGGKIIIDYYTTDDIERILALITGESTV